MQSEQEPLNLAKCLRDASGAAIKELASMVGVSRQAYYEWLQGKTITSKHRKKMVSLLQTYPGQEAQLAHFREIPLDTNSRAKLNIEQVRSIRSSAASGTSNEELARMVGMDPSSISRLVRKKTWRQIP